MKFNDIYNNKPVEFVFNQFLNLIKEDVAYVPRFSMKDIEIFKNIPVNEPVKYSDDLIVKAIQFGMIITVQYKGEKDKHFSGHERSVYPLVLGKSSKGKPLLRVYHLRGWSVSSNRHVEKIWRLFRTDRILSLTFTGSFYRLPPDGYNEQDKGMIGGIIARANFAEIRKNQMTLLKTQTIQNKDEVTITKSDKDLGISSVKVKPTDTVLDLNNPLDNGYVNNIKDVKNIRITFLKSVYGNKYIAILGAIGEPNKTVRVVNERGTTIGVFKTLDSINGDSLKKIKKVKGNTTYDLYIFDKKL
jgi:hypothetical protein